jgi:hypothetical protein
MEIQENTKYLKTHLKRPKPTNTRKMKEHASERASELQFQINECASLAMMKIFETQHLQVPSHVAQM